jgi:AhpD family alkylhydroperoxidase
MLARPEIAIAMGGLSSAVYTQSKLDVREREAARFTIALINDCAVCRATRAKSGEAAGIDEGFYGEIPDWRSTDELSDRERMAAEFAQRFATDHQGMDDDLWDRLRGLYSDEEIADLTMCCGAWLGMGRAMAVIGVAAPDQRLLV